MNVAVRQAKQLTNEESRSVKLSLTADAATLSARAMDVGESAATVAGESYGDFAGAEVAINPAFLLDAIRAVAPKGGKVTIRLQGKDHPVHLYGPETVRVATCLMPVTMRAG